MNQEVLLKGEVGSAFLRKSFQHSYKYLRYEFLVGTQSQIWLYVRTNQCTTAQITNSSDEFCLSAHNISQSILVVSKKKVMDVLTQEICILWLVCINSATRARMETGPGVTFLCMEQCLQSSFSVISKWTLSKPEKPGKTTKKAPSTAKCKHISLVCKFVWVCLYQKCLHPNPSIWAVPEL